MNIDLWHDFKSFQPHKVGAFSKRNWGSPLHSLCSYQGKLKPALAHHLVQAFSKKGDVVLDPFSGSGTIPLESSISGRIPVGNDLSDMAVALTHAKIGITSRNGCDVIIGGLENWLGDFVVDDNQRQRSQLINFNQTIEEYFHPQTFLEILSAREYFLRTKALNDANWCLVFSALLHILHGNRPYALSRRSHPLTPYAPTGDYEYKSVLKHLQTKVHSALSSKESLPLTLGLTLQSDVRSMAGIGDKTVDVILTSPPFASSTRFYMTNWMRFWFCGWERADFDVAGQTFIEGSKDKKLTVYQEIFRSFHRVLKADATVVLHVGKNKAVDMGKTLRDQSFLNFELVDHFSESVEEGEKHGLKDKGGTVEHQYLVYLKK